MQENNNEGEDRGEAAQCEISAAMARSLLILREASRSLGGEGDGVGKQAPANPMNLTTDGEISADINRSESPDIAEAAMNPPHREPEEAIHAAVAVSEVPAQAVQYNQTAEHETNMTNATPDNSIGSGSNHIDNEKKQQEGDPTEILGNTRSAIMRRRGRQPRTGKDYRIAPNEETAIQAALRTAPSRPGEAIFYPYKGTIFNSREEARDFYNLYSWEKGFGVRLHRIQKNNETKYKTSQDIVCSCEGRPKCKNSASARTGCKAKIRLLRRGDDSWYINTVIDSHNHRLTQSCEENKQWGSHGHLDPTTKDFIRKLRENNVSLGRVCDILGLTDNAALTCIRKESVKAYCAKLSQENMKDDMGKTMQLLQEMKKEDPALEVRFTMDSKGTLKRMLWCTGKNRLDYAQFGDAVTFDTTYRTNLYSLPFGLFVGVNNHFQSVIFGGVLLSTEKTEDFEWTFREFVDIMGGKAPKTLLTDQCAAMAAARKSTLKKTRHRWCRWHMLKDAKTHIGPPYSKTSKFKKEFNRLITFETNEIKFETKFRALQEKYDLKENNFLNRLYRYKHMWAKPYFMGVYCAGMTSTQRSESANHMLKATIQKAAPMHLFVRKFRDLQTGRKSAESKGDFGSQQIPKKYSTCMPIEKHAEQVYTKAMYGIFTTQLHLSGYYAIKHRGSKNRFVLSDTRWPDPDTSPETRVHFESEEYITCECGMYEHMGMLCRHALKVLTHLDRRKIPADNIMARWTKDYIPDESNMKQLEHLAAQNDELKRKILLKMAYELDQNRSKISISNFEVAVNAMRTEQQTQKEQVIEEEANQYDVSKNGFPTSCPPSTFRGGRPQSTSLKSWLKGTKKSAKRKTPEATHEANDWPIDDNPYTGKKRRISEI